MSDSIERELKLEPLEPEIMDRLAAIERLGPFEVVGRRTERQRNGFFDTRGRALQTARIGFRRREIEGQRLATWTLKAEGELLRGVATRAEIELQLDAGMPPALVIGTLRDAARQRGAAALAEEVADAMAAGGLPLAKPVLETDTERRLLDLEAGERGWRAELALDRVQLVGHQYAEMEIEVELKRGDEAALVEARAAVEAIGEVREATGSKLSRALAHLATCRC